MKENTITSPVVEDRLSEQEASPALVSALRRFLRPLVRLLIAKQVSYPYLSNLLKAMFVDVARHDIPTQGIRLTDSRLSVMTGVHRKDVKRLVNETLEPLAIPANISLGARLMARWNGEARYVDVQGCPLPLPRLWQMEDRVSFEALVLEESKDIRARAVLDEWLRLGLVTIDDQDRVCLRSGGFVAETGQDEKLYYFGRNLRDHLETAVHNVLGEGNPRIERSVYADGLTKASIDELAIMAETMGMEMLRALNVKARELKKLQDQRGEHRMSLGLYFYHDGDQRHDR